MNNLNEKCAVFGVFGGSEIASRQTYFGLFALQHRGQEYSGIATTDGKEMYSYKAQGLVSQIYTEDILAKLPGFAAIGHNRYSTSRGGGAEHAQPIVVNNIAFAHNGNLPSVALLVEFLKGKNVATGDLSDSELMAHAIGAYTKEGLNLFDAVKASYPLFTGAFSCVALSKDSLVAFRDERGIRPLVIGKRTEKIFVASETCALQTVGAEFLREVEPGEIIVVDKNGIRSEIIKKVEPKFDMFEFVYFARSDSDMLGKSVYEVRKNFGKMLAKESPKNVDIVIPVPETAVPSAIGYSQESGVAFEMALVKNRYIHRTFIEPLQEDRDKKVKIKLLPLTGIISGKRVAVIDDSIVRGTTSRQIVKMLFEAGATEVHFMVASAPVKFPDFYGIDTPEQKDLIASQKTQKEICEYLGATSLSYLSVDGMVEATGLPRDRFSLSAFIGDYPIDLHERESEFTRDVPK
jgi:amidophosphoribosyltransferase